MIQKTGIYPVTVLTTLSKADKMRLIAGGAPLCRQVAEKPEVLESLGFSSKKAQSIIAESAAVCGI
jgi:hypothetical protein